MSTQPSLASHHSVFDTSLRYCSYSQELQTVLSQKAQEKVRTWDLTAPDWKLSKDAKRLANAIFEEYCNSLRRNFTEPEYQPWLECSIQHAETHFLPQLQSIIRSFLPHAD